MWFLGATSYSFAPIPPPRFLTSKYSMSSLEPRNVCIESTWSITTFLSPDFCWHQLHTCMSPPYQHTIISYALQWPAFTICRPAIWTLICIIGGHKAGFPRTVPAAYSWHPCCGIPRSPPVEETVGAGSVKQCGLDCADITTVWMDTDPPEFTAMTNIVWSSPRHSSGQSISPLRNFKLSDLKSRSPPTLWFCTRTLDLIVDSLQGNTIG